MNMNGLESVLAVSRCGSFTAASKKLNRPIATVTRHVKNMEGQMGIQLFENNAGVLSLTEAGRQVLVPMRELLQAYRALTETARNVNSQAVNRLLIGTAPAAETNARIPYILSDFICQYPQVTVNNVVCHATELQQMLLSRQIDCGFFTFADREAPGFDVERMMHNSEIETVEVSRSCGMYIAMSSADPLAQNDLVYVRDLKDRVLFFNSDLQARDYGNRRRVNYFFSNLGVNGRDYQVTYLDFINRRYVMQMVQQGSGVLPQINLPAHEISSVSFVKLADFHVTYTTILAAYRTGTNPNTSALMSHAKLLLSSDGAGMEG